MLRMLIDVARNSETVIEHVVSIFTLGPREACEGSALGYVCLSVCPRT